MRTEDSQETETAKSALRLHTQPTPEKFEDSNAIAPAQHGLNAHWAAEGWGEQIVTGVYANVHIHNRNTRALFEISLVLLLSRGRPKNATCEQMII